MSAKAGGIWTSLPPDLQLKAAPDVTMLDTVQTVLVRAQNPRV